MVALPSYMTLIAFKVGGVLFFVAFRRYCGLWTTHSRPQVVFNFPTGLLLVFPFFSVSPTTSSHIGLSLALIAHASSLVLCNTFSEIPWLNKRQSPLLRQKRGRGGGKTGYQRKKIPGTSNTLTAGIGGKNAPSIKHTSTSHVLLGTIGRNVFSQRY